MADAPWVRDVPEYLAARYPEGGHFDPRTNKSVEVIFRALSELRPAGLSSTSAILSPYSVDVEDRVVLVEVQGGSLQLPAIADHITKFLIIKDATGNAASRSIAVTAAPGETIDGETSRSLVNNWQSFQLVGSGTNWSIV